MDLVVAIAAVEAAVEVLVDLVAAALAEADPVVAGKLPKSDFLM